VHYWGIRGCEAKLRRLLAQGELQFTTVSDHLRKYEQKSLSHDFMA
jgi:hypothetical protein